MGFAVLGVMMQGLPCSFVLDLGQQPVCRFCMELLYVEFATMYA